MRQAPYSHETHLPPPTKTVEIAASLLKPQSIVLDLGAGIGRNGHYLSQQGHRVYSIEHDRQQIIEGRRIARALGGRALRNTFIEADLRNLNLNGRFDAVIASYCLQELQKPEALQTLDMMRRVVKPGGINVLDAYIASPQQQYDKQGHTLFEEGELKQMYEAAGWEIGHYETTGIQPTAIIWDAKDRINKDWINSQEGLITREAALAARQRQLQNMAEQARNINPEYAEELLRQADSL